MGREIRRVSATWAHPTTEAGRPIPMHAEFPYCQEEIEEGLADGWLQNTPPNYGCPVMPQWPEEERTHIQMYENTSEGTPISPVMDCPEKLARWLADNKASAFAGAPASYEHWLATCQRGFAPTMCIGDHGMVSGVEAYGEAPTT